MQFKQLFMLLLAGFLLFPSCKDDEGGNDPGNQQLEGVRFKDEVFANFTKTSNVQYGQNTTENGANLNLTLDFFEPQGDPSSERPLLITVVGGGFVTANRTDFEPIAEYFVKRGYAVANITYRVYDGINYPINIQDSYENVVRAISDLRAAIRYFRADAAGSNVYKIDAENIFALGHSAGAITSLGVAFIDDTDGLDPAIQTIINDMGGIEGNSGNPGFSSDLKGVVSLAGGLVDADLLEAGEIPVISVHGTDDTIVPYGDGFAQVPGIVQPVPIQGSSLVHDRANAVGVTNSLITIENGDHSSPLRSSDCPDCFSQIADFLLDLM